MIILLLKLIWKSNDFETRNSPPPQLICTTQKHTHSHTTVGASSHTCAASLQLPLLLPRRVRGHNSFSLSLTHGLFLFFHLTRCYHSYCLCITTLLTNYLRLHSHWLRTLLLLISDHLTLNLRLWLLHYVWFLFVSLPCNMPLRCWVILVSHYDFIV